MTFVGIAVVAIRVIWNTLFIARAKTVSKASTKELSSSIKGMITAVLPFRSKGRTRVLELKTGAVEGSGRDTVEAPTNFSSRDRVTAVETVRASVWNALHCSILVGGTIGVHGGASLAAIVNASRIAAE